MSEWAETVKLGTMMAWPDRDACAALDAADPLRRMREQFALPAGMIYLDGNSLGPLPRSVPARVQAALVDQWGGDLIRGWNKGWIDLPEKTGAKIARLIGAGADEVIVADSTSVNLFKLLAAALALRPERKVLLSDRANFPTDLYMAQGLIRILGAAHELRLVEADDLIGALDEQTACVMLTHVDFRTGRLHDLASITAAVQRAGAVMLWDLAHSAGAVPIDLAGAGVDLAIGCGYKYLNGGPGAPAFLYVRRDLQDHIQPALPGWMGHARPFDFAPDYAPAAGIKRNLCGTPAILSLVALDAALDLWQGLDIAAVRNKSVALSELFIAAVEGRCRGLGLELASPRDPARRGSHVAFRHEQGYRVMQALIARGVVGDFRAPDLMRFGIAPLYLRYVDVFDAALALHDVLDRRAWDKPMAVESGVVT